MPSIKKVKVIKMESGIKIIYKDKNVIIVEKPIGMPSQSDPSGDKDLMSTVSEYLTEIGDTSDIWLIHRLDRTVGGLITFARNKRAAAELSKIVAEGMMKKEYLAVCHGRPKEGDLRDLLFKDSATSKAYIVKSERRGAKEALLQNSLIAENEGMALCSVNLITGRFHQIRAQFSSRGNPLIGDKKYGSRDAFAKHPALFSNTLCFTLFGKEISGKSLPDTTVYPWNKFEEFFKND